MRLLYLTLILCATLYSIPSVAQTPAAQNYAPWMDESLQDFKQDLKTYNKQIKTTEQAPPPPSIQIKEEKPSTIEKLYEGRILDAPKQFGYDLFGTPSENILNSKPMGAVQGDYILGAGDTITIAFTGQRTDRGTYTIDSRGVVFIDDLPPITALGHSISEFRNTLNAQLQGMHNTNAYISLDSIRQISVLVVGNVNKPGRKTLNMFHTVLDALSLSNGVNKDGSLRNIKLVRNGRSTYIDLYALLMHGAPHVDMRLKDGDRLIVPPIGSTIAISGAVKRPGIYEIKHRIRGIHNKNTMSSEKLSLGEVLDLAGGTLSPTQNRFLKLEQSGDGNETVTQITDFMKPTFSSNTILSIAHGSANKTGQIELIGHTNRPGLYDLHKHKTLSSLLSGNSILGHDIYPLIGVIERYNKEQLGTAFINFPLRLVLNNKFDISLRDNDTIYLLSNDDISNIYNLKNNGSSGIENIDQGSGKIDNFVNALPELKNYIKEHSAFIRGAVRRPGKYPVAQGTTLENIISVAGGLTLEANKESIEVTSKNLGENHQDFGRSGTQRATIDILSTHPSNITISAGDTIRVNQKFRKMDEKTVLIIGEVLHPGEYDILAGDKVSDLIKRAGGLTEQAYPNGAIFSRESERKAEEIKFRAAAHQMEQRLATAIERDKNKPDATQIQMVRDLAKELSDIQAVGRITVETNPTVLSTSPELDMYLEKGDRVYIPKRPLTVRVSGEILSPASLQFRKNKDPLDYIHQAGGFTYHADKNRTFVLYPDGSAEPLRVSTWNHNPIFIPPGSTIVVPRDPKPFDFMESAKDVGQILSNLAITSVFIDDIRD